MAVKSIRTVKKVKKKSEFFENLKQPASLNYLLVAVVGFVIFAFVLSSRGNDLVMLLCGVLAIAGLLLRWSYVPIVIMFFTTYVYFDPGLQGLISLISFDRWSKNYSATNYFEWDMLVAGIAFVAYLMGHFRFISLTQHWMPEDVNPWANPNSEKIKRPFSLATAEELKNALQTLFLGAAIGTLACWLIVRFHPTYWNQVLSPAGSLFLTGLLLVTIFFGLGTALLQYLHWQRMSVAEARMILRDTAYHEVRRETNRQFRWITWYRNKQKRKNNK
ncbi:MAG: hypothetical protein R3B84_13705 [Zavarzinella sp.]